MIIGLSGKKQSGKSTITEYLIDSSGYIEVSWAEPLKKVCSELFGLTHDQLYGTDEQKEEIIPEWGMSSRQILQKVGTECFRNQIRDDFWVTLGKRNIKQLQDQGFNLVISDCRFPNEMDAVHDLGGVALRVDRTDMKSVDKHDSETSLDDYEFDHVVAAKSGDIHRLYDQVDDILEELDATIQE